MIYNVANQKNAFSKAEKEQLNNDITNLKDNKADKSEIPTKESIGLGNVNNTSDIDKPVSIAQATAIADAKKVGTDVQNNLDTHIADTTKHIVTNVSYGVAIGQHAEATSGSAISYGAKETGGGGAVGNNAWGYDGGGGVGYFARGNAGGGAIGYKAGAYGGGAVGYDAHANHGGAVGYGSSAYYGGAVGKNTKTSQGFAGGDNAKAVDASDTGIDAIQLGTGTNSTPKTLQVYDYQLMDANGKIPNERLNIFNNENKIIEDYIDFSPINNQVATILSDTNLLGIETIILDKTNSTNTFTCPKTGIYKIICVGAGYDAYSDGEYLYTGSSGGVSIQNQLLTQNTSYNIGFNQTIGYMTGTFFQVSSDFIICAQNGSRTSGGDAGVLQGGTFVPSGFGKGSVSKVRYKGTTNYYSRGFSGTSPVFVAGLMLSDPKPLPLTVSLIVSSPNSSEIKEDVYNAPSICGFGTGGRSSIYTISGTEHGGQEATTATNDAKPGGIIIIPIAYNN